MMGPPRKRDLSILTTSSQGCTRRQIRMPWSVRLIEDGDHRRIPSSHVNPKTPMTNRSIQIKAAGP